LRRSHGREYYSRSALVKGKLVKFGERSWAMAGTAKNLHAKLARDHFTVMGRAILAHSEIESRSDTILTSFSYSLEYISRSEHQKSESGIHRQEQSKRSHLSLHFSKAAPTPPKIIASAKTPTIALTVSVVLSFRVPSIAFNQISSGPKTKTRTATSRQNSLAMP
jgi:hypothetical protein